MILPPPSHLSCFQEGSQFCRGFGGIGGLLRWQVDFAQLDEANYEDADHDEWGDDFEGFWEGIWADRQAPHPSTPLDKKKDVNIGGWIMMYHMD